MTQQKWQSAMVDRRVDELAKSVAFMDGAEFPEHAAERGGQGSQAHICCHEVCGDFSL